MAVNVKILPRDILYPPELEGCGFDVTAADVGICGDNAYCRLRHSKMKAVEALFRAIESQQNCSAISSVNFGSHFAASYNADGSITLMPRTVIIAGEEFLESHIEINYSYPIAIINPID
jgi:hypothetical protein